MRYKLITPILPIYDYYTDIQKVFAARGIAPENIDHYLNTTIEDIIDPMKIKNMQEGITMLLKHIKNNDKIFVQVDADCDGFTSAAFLINYLYLLFPYYTVNNVSYRVHDGKQHGIIYKTIPDDIKLVIAPDASSNDYEVHEELYKRGCDVLVIDHHEADQISKYACIINNQLCDYPTKSLSGAGMVYKFCSEIDALLGEDKAEELIDLAAVGIIGDMMPLLDYETLEIIRRGINNFKNPFLKELGKIQGYSISKAGGLNPYSIAFSIVPLINAVVRAGTREEKITVFESMLNFKAYQQVPSTKRGAKGRMTTRVEEAGLMSQRAKRRQQKTLDDNRDMIIKIIEDKKLYKNKIIAVKLDDDHQIDRNLTGLMANQLVAKYQHPVLILSKVKHDDGSITWEGSGRGYPVPELEDFRTFLNNSELVVYAQGHGNAFGVAIKDELFDDLINFSNEALKDCEFKPYYNVDFIWHGADFKPNTILKIAGLKSIWGQSMPEPLVAFQIMIPVDSIKLMSQDEHPTLKFELPYGTSAIKFKSSAEEYEDLISDAQSVIIGAVGKCALNDYGGEITPQIIIEEYEVVGKLNSYF